MKTYHSNPPPRPRVDKEGYLRWINTFRAHLPQLAEFARFPRDLSIAARNAYLELPTASQYAPHLARYYRAPAHLITTYRPTSMLFLFQNLHDVISYARAWCREQDAGKPTKRTAPAQHISDEEQAISLAMVRDLANSLTLSPLPADKHI